MREPISLSARRANRTRLMRGLREAQVLQSLPTEQIEMLARHARVCVMQQGQTVVPCQLPAPKLYVVLEGRLRVFRRGSDGREITLALGGPGSVHGLGAIFGSPDERIRLAAAPTAVLACLDGDVLQRALVTSSIALRGLVDRLGEGILDVEQQFGRVTHGDAQVRLVATLQRLIEEVGTTDTDGVRLPARITHRALASEIGTTRETVTRLLSRLARSGYLRRDSRGIVITEPARLAAMCDNSSLS